MTSPSLSLRVRQTQQEFNNFTHQDFQIVRPCTCLLADQSPGSPAMTEFSSMTHNPYTAV